MALTQEKLPSCSTTRSAASAQNFDFQPDWTIPDVISEELEFDRGAICRTVEMLELEQTIPFIARYRKERTNNMEVDQLRDVERLLQELKEVQAKAKYVARSIHAKGKLTAALLTDLQKATTVSEIELVFKEFKPAAKKSLAERAKQVAGLEPLAKKFMAGVPFDPAQYVDPKVKGKEDVSALQTGLQHIIADIIASDRDTGLELKEIPKDLSTKLDVTPVTLKEDKERTKQSKAARDNHITKLENFKNYFSRRHFTLRDIQSFHVLAINRAEKQKLMNVKVEFPERAVHRFKSYLYNRWVPRGIPPQVGMVWSAILKDATERLLLPRLIRDIRSDLTKKAQEGSLTVFGDNLKHLLMTPPISGRVIMGVDPGYRHGCKVAVISEMSEILQTGVVNLNQRVRAFDILTGYLTAYNCRTIAIGNGTACRETEQLISTIIQHPVMRERNCSYCIVNECGASIYSVSPLAVEEMPDLDPNIRSAVSIARRLQNPLAELVKIDPEHLGVGQYQLDLPKGPLKKKLEGVVEDCVSFVGVDINCCSAELLKFVAGVGPAMAKKIIKHRVLKGNFVCRAQLMEVKGLGAKTYQQCAGFIRVNASDFKQVETVDGTSRVKDCRAPPVVKSEGMPRVKTEGAAALSARFKSGHLPLPPHIKIEAQSHIKIENGPSVRGAVKVKTEGEVKVKTEGAVKVKVEKCDDDEPEIVFCKIEGQEKAEKKKRKAPASKTSKSKKVKKTYEANPLDTTWIHPESYEAAERLVSMMGVTTSDLGSPKIKEGVDQLVASIGDEELAQNLSVDVHTLKIIIDGLKNPSNFDLRSDFSVPVFKKGVLSLNDLKVGAVLTGQVCNVVDFGAFVDIGVGQDGLVHSSQMRGMKVVQGNKVEVLVTSLDRKNPSKQRIGLRLKRLL